MPHISKKKLDKEVLNKILDFLIISLTEIKEEKEMKNFLDAFFSSTEKLMFAKRLGVAYLLNEGVDEEKISEVLSLGRPTVSRMRLWLLSEGAGYKIAIDILKKNERFEEFKQVFFNILKEMAKSRKEIYRRAYGLS